MDLLQLKYFQAVARHQHITRAAKELNISQPSLSIMIGRLENEVGMQLFERIGRNIELNEAGKTFLSHVGQVFMELESAKRKLQELSGIKNNRISLATTSSRFLSGLLGEFLSIHPEIKFRQFVSSLEEIRNYLVTEEIDYCITSPPIEGVGIESFELLDDEIFLCVPLSHRYAQCKSIKLRDVADDNFISLAEGYSFRDVTDNLCNMAGFSPNVLFECDTALMSELLIIGKGIALIPKSAEKMYQNTPVALLKIEEPVCRRKISLSWLQGRYMSETARSMQPLIINYFKEAYPWAT